MRRRKVRVCSRIDGKFSYLVATKQEIMMFKECEVFKNIDVFTGIYDRLGNEVYENDIIEFDGKVGYVSKGLNSKEYYIRNPYGCIQFSVFELMRNTIEYKVVGNMHKDLKLLEKANDNPVDTLLLEK